MEVINLNETYYLVHKKITSNKRTMMKSICDNCPHIKTRFISNNILWFEKTNNKLKKVSQKEVGKTLSK